jgi:hypothetical protein
MDQQPRCEDCNEPVNTESYGGIVKAWHCVKCGSGGAGLPGPFNPNSLTMRLLAERHDAVNHPRHYTNHASGVECITVTEHMNFCRGNAVKYIWRAGEKGNEIEDLKKARWYIDREIARLEKAKP